MSSGEMILVLTGAERENLIEALEHLIGQWEHTDEDKAILARIQNLTPTDGQNTAEAKWARVPWADLATTHVIAALHLSLSNRRDDADGRALDRMGRWLADNAPDEDGGE